MRTILPSLLAFALALSAGVFFSATNSTSDAFHEFRKRNVHPDRFSQCEALEMWGAQVREEETGKLGRIIYSRSFYNSDEPILFVIYGESDSNSEPLLRLYSKKEFREELELERNSSRVGKFCFDAN